MKILISDKMSNKVEDVLKSKSIDYDIKTTFECTFGQVDIISLYTDTCSPFLFKNSSTSSMQTLL